MKKFFIVDTDTDFQTRVKSLCPLDEVEVKLFSSGMEIFSLIGKEKPYLILISLEVPDVNDFVMYDLLKKTVDNSIPVVVTYSNQSEKVLQQYKKMKFQPKEYCQKPISNDDIHRLLQNHLELGEEDDDDFSDVNIDRLVRGDYLKVDAKDKDDTKELLADTKNDVVDEVVQPEEDEIEIADILETEEKQTGRTDKELRNQVISLERQNEFLRSENKELSNTIEALKADMEKEKGDFQNRFKELTDQLTDKERELAARDYEFEKSLKNKSEELVQESEERLRSEFSRKESQLEQDLDQLNEEKENLKQLANKLQNDGDELKKREESLNRTLSTLTEEKVILSEKVNSLEETLSSQEDACEEKEKTHLAALESLNKEMEKVLHSLQFYKSRVNELGGLLQQALSLTQTENLK